MAAFRAGDLRLTCDTACSGAWGAHRKEAKGYYDARLWSDLVGVIAKIGMRVDSGYFYLGRAAEAQRHLDAARVYYRLAATNSFKCAGLFNNCDGIDVPREAAMALARLAAIPGETRGRAPSAARTPEETPTRSDSPPKVEPRARP